MITHDLVQGTLEWHAFRLEHDTASEAPAMLDVSPYKKRNALMHEKATGIIEEVNPVTQKLFNKGHLFEALARPLAEKIIGQELYPVTGSEFKLSASFDGLTMMEDIAWEHKMLNKSLSAVKSVADLDMVYKVQMEQQAMVSGAEKILFTATDWKEVVGPTPHFTLGMDGDVEIITYYELVAEISIWYTPDLELRKKIVDGWAQFNKDRAEYKYVEVVEAPKAVVVPELPMVTLQASGELTLSNMDDLAPMFESFLSVAIRGNYETDDDFALAKGQAKVGRLAATRCREAAKMVIDQMPTVMDVVRSLETYAGKFDALALEQEKAVKTQEDNKKTIAKLEREKAYLEHIAALSAEISPIQLIIPAESKPNFIEAMKNKRTLVSLYNSLDSELARVRIAADDIALIVRYNLGWYTANGMKHAELFADLQSLIYKKADDFQLAINDRINKFNERQREIEAATAARIAAEDLAAAQVKPAEPPKEPEPQKAPETSNVVEMRPAPTAELRAAVVEHQDEISGFLATIEVSDKTKQTVRAYLVEFVKYQVARAAKAA